MIFTSVLICCWDYSNLCFDFTQLKHSLCVTERKGRGGVGEGQIWDDSAWLFAYYCCGLYSMIIQSEH